MAKNDVKKKAGFTATLTMAAASLFGGTNNETQDDIVSENAPITQTVDAPKEEPLYVDMSFQDKDASERTHEEKLNQALYNTILERDSWAQKAEELEEEQSITAQAHQRRLNEAVALKKENAELQKDVTELNTSLDERGRALNQANADLERQQKELDAINAEREKLLQKIVSLEEALEITDKSVVNQAKNSLDKGKSITQLKEELAITNAALLNQSKNALEKEKAIKKQEKEIKGLKEELAITNASLQNQASENLKKDKKIAALQEDVSIQTEALMKTGDELLHTQAALDESKKALARSVEEKQALTQKAQQLEMELKKAEEENAKRADFSVEQSKKINALKLELINTNKKLIQSMKAQISLNDNIKELQEQLDIVNAAHQRRTVEAEQVKKENKGLKQQLAKIKAENQLATKDVPFNPYNYMNSGEKMGVAIYTQVLEDGTEIIKGVESCTIGKGGYSGCEISYASSGDAKSHAHFRDNIHVTRASGRSTVRAVNADGKYQMWEAGEYNPDEYYEKVFWLTNSSKPIVAMRVQEQEDGSYKYFSETNKGVLKQAMDRLEAGTKSKYFVSRYNQVSRER